MTKSKRSHYLVLLLSASLWGAGPAAAQVDPAETGQQQKEFYDEAGSTEPSNWGWLGLLGLAGLAGLVGRRNTAPHDRADTATSF